MRSNVTVLGHPIHPMLVAFPIALYTGTLGCLIAVAVTGDPFFARAAELACGLALIAATAAAIPGLVDYFTVVPEGGRARRTARIHAGANVVALVLFGLTYAFLATRGEDWLGRGLVLSSLGLVITLVAGFHGWALVQDHHVGVRERALDRELAAGPLDDRDELPPFEMPPRGVGAPPPYDRHPPH
jgi:uncharacterized membrane protein